jgi:hypothetical protein
MGNSRLSFLTLLKRLLIKDYLYFVELLKF